MLSIILSRDETLVMHRFAISSSDKHQQFSYTDLIVDGTETLNSVAEERKSFTNLSYLRTIHLSMQK